MKSPVPTMREVAQRVGVSTSTVSLALRNSPLVAEETRKRIRELADQLGYKIHPLVAAHMRSRRKPQIREKAPMIALVDSQRRRHGWRDNRTQIVRAMLAGAKAQAADRGYATREFWLHEPGITHARFSEILRARGFRGLLIGPSSDLELELELRWEWFAVVRLGSAATRPALHRVVADHYQAGMIMARRIHALGYRRPLVLVREKFSKVHDRRLTGGFQTEWAHLPGTRPAAVPVSADLPDGPTLARWIRRYRPDVVVDNEESHAYNLLKADGWKIPEEIGVASLCVEDAGGPSSGCVQNGEAIGRAGINYLLNMIERNETGLPKALETLAASVTWNPGLTLRPAPTR